jgi:hypothetical protein
VGSSISYEFLHPRPAPQEFGGLWVAGANDVFVCGSSGTVLRRQGGAWTSYDTDAGNGLFAIWGASPSDVFAVGEGGTVVRFDGRGWHEMNTGVLHSLRAVWGTSSDNVYAVGYRGSIIHYNGAAWEIVDHGLTAGSGDWHLYDIWGTAADDIFVVGYHRNGSSQGLVWHYDGTTWTETRTGTRLYAVAGTASNNVFVAGSSGQMYRFDGSDWLTQPNLGSDDIHTIWCASASDIWAGGHTYDYGMGRYIGALWRFNGTSWNNVEEGTFEDYIEGIDGSAEIDVYLVGEGNQLAHFDGSDWGFINEVRETGDDLSGIWGFSYDDIWAVGSYGTILHYDGSIWADVSSGTDMRLGDVWGPDPAHVYAAGEAGTILFYGGSAWAPVLHGLGDADLSFVWGTSATDVWFGGSASSVFYYDGAWHDRSVDAISYGYVNGIWSSAPDDCYVLLDGSILHFDGASWDILTIENHAASAVFGLGAGDVYFLAEDRAFAPNARAGEGLGRSPAQPVGATHLFRYNGSEFQRLEVEAGSWLSGIWVSGAGSMFFTGGPYAKILHYNGSAMAERRIGEGIWLNDLWGDGPDTVYASGSMGTVVRITAQ